MLNQLIIRKFKHVLFSEKEMNRLLRSPVFCNSTITEPFHSLPEEDRILQGKNCKIEQKLVQRSPLSQEIILENHDYRMLSIGISNLGM